MRTTEQEIIQAYPQSSHVAKDIVRVSNNLNIDPSWLANVIRSESNFSTTIQNKDTRATGLIQFIPSTANGLGTSIDELRNMSPTQQMDYVEKYFQPYKSQLKDQNSVVLAVFYPKAINKPDDWDMAGDYASGKAQYGTDQWNYYVDRFMNQNGGIRYKGDYYKKFINMWKLSPKTSNTAITQKTQTSLQLVPNWVWYVSATVIIGSGIFFYSIKRR